MPQDALTLPRRQVTAQSPICIFDAAKARIERLQRKDSGLHGLSVGTPAEAVGAAPGVFLFERETAFDALVEQRLLAKIQSPIPGARWPVEAMVLQDGEILAYARETLGEADGGLAQTSAILSALQTDTVRTRILQTGRATLRVRVGSHPWDTIPLRRVDGEVDWSQDDPAASLPRPAREVSATASKPFRFADPSSTTSPRARAFRFEDGRLAAPARIEAPGHLGLGDLTGDFTEVDGCRRLRGDGGGLLGLARARRAWATAQISSLADLATRTRVVRQFEEPLVTALCGPQWRGREREEGAGLSAARILFDLILPEAVGDQLGDLDREDHEDFAARFADAIDRACPAWAEDGEIDDEEADRSLSEAFAAMLEQARAQGRMADVDADEMDFGASGINGGPQFRPPLSKPITPLSCR